jgi:hypothetical protein
MRTTLRMTIITVCVSAAPLMCSMDDPADDNGQGLTPTIFSGHSSSPAATTSLPELIIPMKVRPKSTNYPPRSGTGDP